MGKSSSDRRRSGSELSSKPARRANDEDGPSRSRTDSQSMTSSSRRKSSRPDPSYNGDHAPAESSFAPILTDEPSEISSTHPSQHTADDWEQIPSRSQRVRESERSPAYNARRGNNDQYNDSNSTRRHSEPSRRDSRRSSKTDRKSSTRGYGENEASLPQNQFPGEFPATYSQPYRPPGLAAEYYGDGGESVAFQPGVRPVPPSIVTSAEQAHLMEPTIEAKPPPEPSTLGAVGAAASFFGPDDFNHVSGVQTMPSKLFQKVDSKTSKPPVYSNSVASPKPSPQGIVPTRLGGASTGGGYQTPSRLPAGGSYSGSHPVSAPADFAQPQQQSNAALYGGAALVGAAAGAFMNSQSHHEQAHSQHYSTATHGPQGSFHGHSPYHSASVQQVHRHRRRGPLGKLVDWFRDPDAVAEYEQYTEAIGVCKYCFDPMSSPAEAPRRHHYHRRVSSSGSRYGSSTRVDKVYRYSSDEERRKRSGTKKIVVGGLAGYGAAKIGDAILKSKHDFDDNQSVKTGRPINRNRVSFQDEEFGRSRRSRRYSSSSDAYKQKHDSDRKTSKTSERHNRSSARRRDSNSSPPSLHASRGVAISTAAGAAALAVGASSADKSSRRRSRSRSRSPPKKPYYSKRVSPMHSYVDLSATNTGPGGIASFFSSPSANKKRGQKSRGFFNFANASSSSSDADLAFGAATVRRKSSRRFSKEHSHRRDSNAALLGLVATGQALADESVRRQKKGKERYDADEMTGRSSRRTNQQRISVHEDDFVEGHDDGWYDTDDDANQSVSSVDTALAYGEEWSGPHSRDSLVQHEGYPQPILGSKEEHEKRHEFDSEYAGGRHSSAPQRTTSGPSTEFGAAAAIGALAASSGYGGKIPSSSHSNLPPLRELEPRPISDLNINEARNRLARKNEPSANYMPEGTRVLSTSVPLQQPQPVTPVAPFLQDNDFETTPVTAYSYDLRQHEPESAPLGQVPSTQGEKYVERERVRPDRRKDSNSNERSDAMPAPSATSESVQRSGRKANLIDQPSSDTQQRPRDSSDQRVLQIERELELLYAEQKQQERERKKRDRGSKDGVETAATVVAAAAAAASAVVAVKEKSGSTDKGGSPPRRKSNLKQSKERQSSPQNETQQERMERMKAKPSRSTTPSPVYENYGSFFVPKELQEHLKEHNAKAEHRDDIGATVVEIIPGATRPRKPHSFDPDLYRPFGLDLDDDPTLFPWPVPLLSLIEPTPPGSQAHSVQGDASPIITPTSVSESAENPRDPSGPSEGRSARGTKVTWGEHDTYVYEVATPEYEQTGYMPEGVTKEEKLNGPMPDITNEETMSFEDAEDVPTRPTVSRVWTLDEKDAENLEKEVPVVDDRPNISRTWTVDDSEADQIEHETPNVRQNNDKPDEEASHIIEVAPGQSEIQKYPQILDEIDNDVGGPAKMRSSEDQTPSNVYRSPFAETVSDLGMTPDVVRHAQHSEVSEPQHADDREHQDGDLRSSPAARVSKSEKRRKERANPSSGEPRAFDSILSQGDLDENNEEMIPEPEVPGNESGFKNLLTETGGVAVSLVSGLATGVAALTASGRDDDTSPSKEERSDLFDDLLDHQRSKSTEHYQSDPEEWERPKESKKSKKSKKSKRSSRDDPGVDRRAEVQQATDDAAFGTPTRSNTLEDISDLREPTMAGSENRKSKRKSKRRDAEPEESSISEVRAAERDEEVSSSAQKQRASKDEGGSHSAANNSVISESKGDRRTAGFFSSIFSSNKSDVSTSSKKSSRSSKSNDRVDSGDDQRKSRKKRSSRDKDYADILSQTDELSTRSREIVESAEPRDDQALSSRDQSMDNGFVSAEENGDSLVDTRADDNSFLATRPGMPIPTVMDMPMETDGVSGPESEYNPSGITGSGLEGSVELQPESLAEVGERDVRPAEQDPTRMRSADSEAIPFQDQHRMSEVDVIAPQQAQSLETPQPTSSRRLSAIRTADIPWSPVVTSSPTAVPLHFRRPPPSPTTGRFPTSSPMDSPSSPLTTPRTRQGRPKSTEFRSSTEFRPLYLVERQNFAKTATPEAVEDYPSLPSSKTSSAHASTEDLRGEAQAQEHDYTPSRINAHMFRERGRRHSYSYWDDEKRRVSPEYLDSRSATPVPGDAQRARESERKSKPKYEFHSPSELLQDPSTYQEGPPADWDDGLASPLPSVLSADQDCMSARSRSLSPTGSRGLSHKRTSRPGSRSASSGWQDALPTLVVGALAGSVLGLATSDVTKPAERQSVTTDSNPAHQSEPVLLPEVAQDLSEDVLHDRVLSSADPTLLSERPRSAIEKSRDDNVPPDLSSVLTAQHESAPLDQADSGAVFEPVHRPETAINDVTDTTGNSGDEPSGGAVSSALATPADDDFRTPQENVPVGHSELSPFEQSFEAAVQARGVTENSTVEEALHVLQADDGDSVAAITLTTIDRDTELPTLATEQEMAHIESDPKVGRKISKKEKRKAKKGSKQSSNTDDWDTADRSADQQEMPESAQSEAQPAGVSPLNVTVAEDALNSRNEQPESFGDGLDPQQDEPKPGNAKLSPNSEARDIDTVVEETRPSGGPVVEVPLTSNPKVEEDDWYAAPRTSKKDKKGKKSKKKQVLSWEDDEPSTGSPLDTAEPVPAQTSREFGTGGTSVQDSSLTDVPLGESQLESVMSVTLEQAPAPGVANTAVAAAEEPPTTDAWENSTKKGKKKSKKKSLAWVDDTDRDPFAEGAGATLPAAEPEVSQKEEDSGTTQRPDVFLGGAILEEPAGFALIDADTRTEDPEKRPSIVSYAKAADTEDPHAPPAENKSAQLLREDEPADDDWGFATARSTKKKDKKKRASKAAANPGAEASMLTNDGGEEPARSTAAEKEPAEDILQASADTPTPTMALGDSGVEWAAMGQPSAIDDNVRDLESPYRPEGVRQNNEKADREQELLPDDKDAEQIDRFLIPDTSPGEASFLKDQNAEVPVASPDFVEDPQQVTGSNLDLEHQVEDRDAFPPAPTPESDQEIEQLESEGLAAHPAIATNVEDTHPIGPSPSAAQRELPTDASDPSSAVDMGKEGPSAGSQPESKDVEEDFGFSFKPAKTKKEKKGKKKRAILQDDFDESPVVNVDDESLEAQERAPTADPVALPATSEPELPVEVAEVPGAFPPATPEPALHKVDEDDEFPMMMRRKSKKEKRKKRQSVLGTEDSEPAKADLEDQVTPNFLEASGVDEHREMSDRALRLADVVATGAAETTEAEEMGEDQSTHQPAVHDAVVDQAGPSGGERTHMDGPTVQDPTLNVPPAEETAAEALPVDVPLPESPARDITAEETSATNAPTDQPSSFVGFALKGITGAVASAVKSIASVAPLTVESPDVKTPAVETPAIETPAVETPAVETPAVETPVVETPAVETPVVETPVPEGIESGAPKRSEAATDDGWDFPMKVSKRDKKKKRQSALSSMLAEPQELPRGGEIEGVSGDVENVSELEAEHTKDVVLDAVPDTRDVLEDVWGVATKKTKKEKKKKRQSTFDTLDVQSDTSPAYGREALSDDKALSGEDVQATRDLGTEDPATTEASKIADPTPGTVVGDDQDDDFFGFTSKKSKKDKKKKRQSGFTAAADADAGIPAVSQASEDDPAASKVEEQTRETASPAGADIDVDEQWAFTTTRSKDKKKKRKSNLDEVSTVANEGLHEPKENNETQGDSVREAEESVSAEHSAPVQAPLPRDGPALLHDSMSTAETTTVEERQHIDNSAPIEEPMDARELMPGAWSLSTEEPAPAQDSARYDEPVPAEQLALAQVLDFYAGNGKEPPRRLEDDVRTTKERLDVEKNAEENIAAFEPAKNTEGNAGPGYSAFGEVISAAASVLGFAKDAPEKDSSPRQEKESTKESPMPPGAQIEVQSPAADDEWGFAVKKSKKDKKKKRQATLDDVKVKPQSSGTQFPPSNQELLETSNHSQDPEVKAASLERDAMNYDAPQSGAGPAEEEEWSMSKKSKKDKKQKKRQSTFDDGFAEGQSAPDVMEEASLPDNHANARQYRGSDAPLAIEAAMISEATSAFEDDWTPTPQSKKDKKKKRATGDVPYADRGNEEIETLTSETTQPGQPASGEHRIWGEDRRDEASPPPNAPHHFDTTVSSSPIENVMPPTKLEPIDESGSQSKEQLPRAAPPQVTAAGSDRAFESGRSLVQGLEAFDSQRSAENVVGFAEAASDPLANHNDAIASRPTFTTLNDEPVEAAVLEPQVKDQWSIPTQKSKKGKEKKRQSTLQESLREPEEPPVRQVDIAMEEPAQAIEPRSKMLENAELVIPESSAERPSAENAAALTEWKGTIPQADRWEDDTMDVRERALSPLPQDVGDAAIQMEPSADSGIATTEQDQPPLPAEEEWGFPVKKSKKKTKKTKSRFSNNEQATPETETPGVMEQDDFQPLAPRTVSPEPVQDPYVEEQTPATPAETAADDYFAPIKRKKSKKDKKRKALPVWIENDEQSHDRSLEPVNEVLRPDEVRGDMSDAMGQDHLPLEERIDHDQDVKKAHRLFEFNGTEPHLHDSTELGRNTSENRVPTDPAVPFDQLTQTSEMIVPPEDVETMSDVSASTRERRKRRRSPPAWSGEEPQDLPRNRALTPPPEHDDLMDTALGIAAGLGIGASEHDEPAREVTREPRSPARQLSSKWSFAQSGPVADRLNRDSGVQLESPLLAQGQISSTRDSGFVPDPADQQDRPYGSREVDPAMYVSLRPPRPQSPTSSTEDVTQTISSKGHQLEDSVLETPRRKPSPIAATSKDRSSALFNSSPAVLTPLDTKYATRSPEPVTTPLRRSPSIHGHHNSREQLRQLGKTGHEIAYNDHFAFNPIDPSTTARVHPSAYHVVTQDRAFSPRNSLKAIREEPVKASGSPEMKEFGGAGLGAAAGIAGLAAAGGLSTRPRDLGPAKSLGTSKSRTSSLRNLREDSTSPFDLERQGSNPSRGSIDDKGLAGAATRDRDMADIY
ncbi:hypothetical protein EDD36DRAFT_424075, partial [Exophiala viscosa]